MFLFEALQQYTNENAEEYLNSGRRYDLRNSRSGSLRMAKLLAAVKDNRMQKEL